MTSNLTADESSNFSFSRYFDEDFNPISKKSQYLHKHKTHLAPNCKCKHSNLSNEWKINQQDLHKTISFKDFYTTTCEEDKIPSKKKTSAMPGKRKDMMKCCDKHFELDFIVEDDEQPKKELENNLLYIIIKTSLIGLLGVGIACLCYQFKHMTESFNEVSKDLLHITSEIQTLSKDMDKTALSQDSLVMEIQDISRMLGSGRSMSSDPNMYSQSERFLGVNDVRSMLESELSNYDADKTSRVDFALESAGGKIVSIRNTKPFHLKTNVWNSITNAVCPPTHAAKSILNPEVQPGQCFAFHGAEGEVIIRLLGRVHVSALTLEHIPVAISPTQEISSAPKEFSFWGLKDKNEESGFFFGQFTYKKDGPPRQLFFVQEKTSVSFKIVRLKIDSNWGHPEYTCIYRLRVHGKLDKRKYSKKNKI